MWKRPYPWPHQTPTAPPPSRDLGGRQHHEGCAQGDLGTSLPPPSTCSVLVAELQPEASGGLGMVAAGLGRRDSAQGLTSAAPVSPAGRSRRLLAVVYAAGAAINPSANGKLEHRAHTSRVTLWGERGRGELR